MIEWVADCEGDSLYPTKIHVLSVCNLQTKEIFSTNDYDKMRSFFLSAKDVVIHNGIRWDKPNLERLLEIKIPARIVDSLPISWYLYPEGPLETKKHGLEEWGQKFGVPKPKVEDWENLSYEEYKHRCEEDVKINTRLWETQLNFLKELYPNEDELNRFLDYLMFKMECAQLQEESGWKLDQEYCKASLQELLQEQTKKVEALTKVMPQVPILKTKSRPKVMYKKDWTLSKRGEEWERELAERNLPGMTEEFEYTDGYEDGNPNSPEQVKAWLYSFGWVPETFKTVKNKKTGEKKEVVQVNREKQKGGGICPSIIKLYDKEPNLELLEGLGILQHRIGILNGFLDSVDSNGYVRARVAGFTNTLRFKHAEIVNLPKVNVEYGENIRGCLVAEEGYELCGADMTSLEDRLKQHFIYPLDPEYVKEMQRPGFDPHIDIAVLGGMMSQEDGSWYCQNVLEPSDDDSSKRKTKTLKKIRDPAKNTNYACQYGAYPPRIATTAGISIEQARILFDTYWKRNWAIKEVVAQQTMKEVGTLYDRGMKWLKNPVNGFWYWLKNTNDVFSTLVQGTASFCFDVWVKFILEQRRQLTGQFHDEKITEIKLGFREEAKEMCYAALKKTNDMLKLNRQLDIGVQFGKRYSEIH